MGCAGLPAALKLWRRDGGPAPPPPCWFSRWSSPKACSPGAGGAPSRMSPSAGCCFRSATSIYGCCTPRWPGASATTAISGSANPDGQGAALELSESRQASVTAAITTQPVSTNSTVGEIIAVVDSASRIRGSDPQYQRAISASRAGPLPYPPYIGTSFATYVAQ